MTRLLTLLWLVLATFVLPAATAPLRAEVQPREEIQKLDNARAVIKQVETDRPGQANNFSGLLDLRDKLDPVRDDLSETVEGLQQKLAGAKAQLAELGPEPAAGAAEPAQQAKDRKDKQQSVRDFETRLRAARALMVQAEQLWDELTDARRALFNSRIFEHSESFLSLSFWRSVLMQGMPLFLSKAHDELVELEEAIEAKGGWSILLALALFTLTLIVVLVVLDRWFTRHWLHLPDAEETPTKRQMLVRASVTLLLHTLPSLAAALVIWVVIERYDITPDEMETFLYGLAGAGFVFSLGTGSIRAVFAPHAAAYRLVRADDATARRSVRVLDTMLLVYFCGIVVLGLIQMLSAPVTLTIAMTGVIASSVVIAGGALLAGVAPVEPGAQGTGLVQVPLHLLRPVFWLLAIVIVGALALGFVAFAGFIVGRAIATTVILCVAVLVYVAIDVLLHDAIAPGKPANRYIAVLFGIRPSTVDLIATILAGTLRVATVVLTVLVLLSPWGIEFGNLNPLEDVFFGVRFGDLRGWIGAAGIAIVLFAVGVVTTRLFVTWLDRQLLPRTTLNPGLQHSITTIAGYLGFLVALAIALNQAGVQLQNIALVASALSVGIGFGLQQVVSNFVAGLIVLAERPIRVGDVISVKGEEGKVRKISVRATEIVLGENSTVIVPNSDIVSSIVKNRSFHGMTQRASVKLTVTHDADLELLFEILLKAAGDHDNVLSDPAPAVFVSKVSEAGIETDLQVVVDRISKVDAVRSDIFRTVLPQVRRAGIRLAVGAVAAPPAAKPTVAEAPPKAGESS